MAKKKHELNCIHVSKILRDWLKTTRLTQKALCEKTGITKEELKVILTEGSEITLEQSKKLSKAFDGVGGEFLYNFNKLYEEQQERIAQEKHEAWWKYMNSRRRKFKMKFRRKLNAFLCLPETIWTKIYRPKWVKSRNRLMVSCKECGGWMDCNDPKTGKIVFNKDGLNVNCKLQGWWADKVEWIPADEKRVKKSSGYERCYVDVFNNGKKKKNRKKRG